MILRLPLPRLRLLLRPLLLLWLRLPLDGSEPPVGCAWLLSGLCRRLSGRLR
jgi:hypothetical protein